MVRSDHQMVEWWVDRKTLAVRYGVTEIIEADRELVESGCEEMLDRAKVGMKSAMKAEEMPFVSNLYALSLCHYLYDVYLYVRTYIYIYRDIVDITISASESIPVLLGGIIGLLMDETVGRAVADHTRR